MTTALRVPHSRPDPSLTLVDGNEETTLMTRTVDPNSNTSLDEKSRDLAAHYRRSP